MRKDLSVFLVSVSLSMVACKVEGQLPPLDDTDESGDPTDSDTDTDVEDPETDPPPPPPGVIVFNEVMASNDSTIAAAPGVYADWVEIVNVSDAPIDWANIVIVSDEGVEWQRSPGTFAPGERYLLWADDMRTNDYSLGYGLSKEGGTLSLELNGEVQATVNWPEMPSDASFARTPDATGPFFPTAYATPGAENFPEVSATLDIPIETVFTDRRVHEIRLTLDRQNLAALDAGGGWGAPREDVHAAMEFDGVEFPDIGLRLKGSGSFQPLSGKPNFIVDMNEWVDGLELRGLEGFRLHNGFICDPTRVREWITYSLARESGLMAPRSGWAEVWLNNEYYGFYPLVELHDEDMIARFYPDQIDVGVMVEPNESFGDFGWGGINETVLQQGYEEGPVPPDPNSLEVFYAVDRILARPATDDNLRELWDYVDQDLLLTYMAWEAMIVHIDGYMAPNNWRIFVNGTTYKMQLVPSGAEWSWEFPVQTFNSNGRLSNYCLSNDTCSRAYARRALDMADRVEAMNLEAEFDRLSQWADPWIQADPRYTSACGDTAQARRTTTANLLGNPDRTRDAVRARYPNMVP